MTIFPECLPCWLQGPEPVSEAITFQRASTIAYSQIPLMDLLLCTAPSGSASLIELCPMQDVVLEGSRGTDPKNGFSVLGLVFLELSF